jgi:ATP-dependent DNA ligase
MYGSEWSTQENRSGKLFLFDVTELEGSGLDNEPYHARYARLQKLGRDQRLPQNWSIITNHPTIQIDAIWSNLVESGKFEGVVFRNPSDTWHVDLLRAKLSITEDLRIIDFEEGKNRLTGCLGALIAVGSDGVTHSIGGGLTDKQRKAIWKDKELYRGKIIVVEAKKKFASGQLRHPNFLEFHPDKITL